MYKDIVLIVYMFCANILSFFFFFKLMWEDREKQRYRYIKNGKMLMKKIADFFF